MRIIENKKFNLNKKILLSCLLLFLIAMITIVFVQVKTTQANALSDEVSEDFAVGDFEDKPIHATGWIPETREQIESVPLISFDNVMPLSIGVVDYTDYFPSPGNQGEQGSCVAWAVGYAAKSYLVRDSEKWDVKKYQFSPSYIYNQLNDGVNKAINICDAMYLVVEQGVCLLKDMPYNDKDFLTQPTQEQRTLAEKYRSLSVRCTRDGNVGDMKAVLNNKQPVVIGVPVYPDLYNLSPSNQIYDSDNGKSMGGHALCVIGYDDNLKAFKFINSWGKSSGVNGYGYISYSLIEEFKTTG